jgi:hypothetical protein
MAKTDPRGIVAARAGTLLAVGLVVLIMVVLEAHPARATFPGKPGKIAYDAFDGQDYEIYTINPDGGVGSNLPTTLRTTTTLPTRPVARR